MNYASNFQETSRSSGSDLGKLRLNPGLILLWRLNVIQELDCIFCNQHSELHRVHCSSTCWMNIDSIDQCICILYVFCYQEKRETSCHFSWNPISSTSGWFYYVSVIVYGFWAKALLINTLESCLISHGKMNTLSVSSNEMLHIRLSFFLSFFLSVFLSFCLPFCLFSLSFVFVSSPSLSAS